MTTPRLVPLEGCCNFRHLGGYRLADGRTTRPGVVYRSDSLHRLTAADLATLAGTVGVRSAIDLRSHTERERAGMVVDDAPFPVHHLPAIDDTMQRRDDAPPPAHEMPSMAHAYVGMLEHGAPRYAAAVRIIADADEQPVVFFCMAGKDRTGILSAMLLGLVGVSDDDIIDDYVQTAAVITTIRERILVEMPEMAERWKAMPAAVLDAAAETMADTLQLVDERWGGFEGWARESGVDEATLDRLRQTLVDAA